VGTSGDYPPFSTTEGADFAGLDVDVARRYARDTGRPLELVPFRWPDLMTDLGAGRFDVAMGGVTMRPERAVRGTFTRPVVETGAVLLVPPSASGGPIGDLTLRVAVNRGGHLERVARAQLPRAHLVPTDQNQALAALVLAGQADAVLTDDVEADLLVRQLPGFVRRGPLTRDRKAYLARDPGLAADLDTWLRAREADGTLDALRARWLGRGRPEGSARFHSDLHALLALVDLRLAFMPAIAAAKAAAGRPVTDPAQETRVLAAVRTRAGNLGLDDAALETLFRTQLAAARERQETFLATPLAERPPVEPLDLDTEARPALARISDSLVERAADLASDPAALATLDPTSVADALDPSLATRAARRAIADAIVGLRLAEGSAHE
jgi:cyclohexadienyl dehydratase